MARFLRDIINEAEKGVGRGGASMNENILQLEMVTQTDRERFLREWALHAIKKSWMSPDHDIEDFIDRSAAPNGRLNQYMLGKAIERRTERKSQNSRRFAYVLVRIAKFITRITEALKFKRSYVKA